MNASDDPEFNPYAAPKAVVPTFAGKGPAAGQGMWAEGKLLVLTNFAEFPDTCVKCNEPAGGYRLMRNLYWHPPAYYFVILINILLYVIVALIVRKTAKIHIGLCPRHRASRRNAILVGWGAFFLTIGLIVAASALNLPEGVAGILGISAFVVFIVGIIYSIARSRIVAPTRMDGTLIWLKGAGPEFLGQLKAWPPVG